MANWKQRFKNLGYVLPIVLGSVIPFALTPLFTDTNPCVYHEPINRELGQIAKFFFVSEVMGHPIPRWWLILTSTVICFYVYHRLKKWMERSA